MDLVPVLSTIILWVTIITLIVALVAYIVFRLKERQTTKQPTPLPAIVSISSPPERVVVDEVINPRQIVLGNEDATCRICENLADAKKNCPFRNISPFCYLANNPAPQAKQQEEVIDGVTTMFRIYKPPQAVNVGKGDGMWG